MKKSLFILLALILALLVWANPALATADATEAIKIILDGKELQSDVPPIIEQDRTLAPMRVVFEALGCKIDWQPQRRAVAASTDKIMLVLTIDDTVASLYDRIEGTGSNITLDVPAKIVDGRTMVPLRFIATSLGCLVDWQPASRSVIITSNQAGTDPDPDNNGELKVYADFPQVPDFGLFSGFSLQRKDEDKAATVPFLTDPMNTVYYYYSSNTADYAKIVENYGQQLRNRGFELLDSKYDSSQSFYILAYKKGELYVAIENSKDYFRIIIAQKSE